LSFQIPDEQNKEWFIVSLLPHIRVFLMQQKVASQAEALEITMKLESTPMGESNLGMSQILSQLTSLSLQVEDMKKDKGKYKREDIWCIRCNSEGHDKENCPLFHEYLASGALIPLKQVTLPWCEVCRNRHRLGECYYMKKYVQTPTNIYCTFCKYVGHDEKDCRAYDLLHERSRDTYRIQERCSKREILHNLTLQEEETSTLVVDSEEEDEEEAWVKVKVRSFVITAHSQVTWKGTVRTLVPLAATATHLNMLLKSVLRC
jgi:hypothetical protein